MKEQVVLQLSGLSRRYLDSVPALQSKSREQAHEILKALREWYPNVPLKEIPEEGWEFFLNASQHSKTAAQVGSELEITENDINDALSALDTSEDKI
jgi:hypothetical protein